MPAIQTVPSTWKTPSLPQVLPTLQWPLIHTFIEYFWLPSKLAPLRHWGHHIKQKRTLSLPSQSLQSSGIDVFQIKNKWGDMPSRQSTGSYGRCETDQASPGGTRMNHVDGTSCKETFPILQARCACSFTCLHALALVSLSLSESFSTLLSP